VTEWEIDRGQKDNKRLASSLVPLPIGSTLLHSSKSCNVRIVMDDDMMAGLHDTI
jgi:hypothetical protein